MGCTVRIASPLQSYTGAAQLSAEGDTLELVLADLERRFPGIRFRVVDEQNRIRRHIRLFVDEDEAADLKTVVGPRSTVQLVCALSGG